MRKHEAARQPLLQDKKMAAIGQLAAGVAHEINNPLAFISCNLRSMEVYAEELLRTAADARLHKERYGAPGDGDAALDLEFFRQDIAALLTESRSGIARIADIVRSLCLFSQIDADREWRLTDLNASLKSACDLIAPEVGAGVEILSGMSELPLIECQANQIDQVFINLLSNAVRAVGSNGRIWLSSGGAIDEVWVEVADNGCGVTPEHLDRLFEPFFTTRAVGHGMGLGLAVAYGIVKGHGGELSASNRPGGGSVFRVVLPVEG